MLDTVDYLKSLGGGGSSDDGTGAAAAAQGIDPDTLSTYADAAAAVGAAAAAVGYDAQHGGVFESGSPEGPISKAKVWWVQAESVLAFWKLHQHALSTSSSSSNVDTAGNTGSNSHSYSKSSYLQMLVRTASFVRRHLTDSAGEQFWQVRESRC